MTTKTVNEWRAREVAAFLKTYSSDHVFNADEAEIFYQLDLRKTLTFKGDKCIGVKTSQQRITAPFCRNKSGTKKRKKLIVGHPGKPRCFKNYH